MNVEILEKIILKTEMPDYLLFIQDFDKMDKIDFYKKYKKLIGNGYDKEDFLESYDEISRKELLLFFTLGRKIIYEIDWSGEEYPGQVKKSINQLLKNCDIEKFNWKKIDIMEEIEKLGIKRGEYLPWLFKNLNIELEAIQYQIKFIDMGNDSYYYFVISNENYDKVKHLKNMFLDMKTYEMYLLTKTMNSKIMLYLKNKFNVKLDEIKNFINQEKILILTGNDKQIKYEQEKINEIGGEINIFEKL